MSSPITTELVKELRDATGISIMQCKRALEEAEGDMNKALAILKKTSGDIALKKNTREVKAGAVIIKNNANKAVIVTLLCETDFVAKNEDFTSLLSQLGDMALSDGIEKTKENSKELINAIIQKTGENIQLGEMYEVVGEVLGNYVHNNKIAIIVSLNGGSTELARDVAMHVAAMKPEYIKPSDIDEENKKTMMEVFQKEVDGIDKPKEIKEKMLAGKISTYFKEKTLVDQPFIKDGNITVGKLLENAKAEIKEVKRCSI